MLVGEVLPRPGHTVSAQVSILSMCRCDIRRELAQLVAHHLLGDQDLQVVLAIVDLELQSNEVGEDGGGAGLRLDRGDPLAGLGPYNGESGEVQRGSSRGCTCSTYGTMLGPGKLVSFDDA